MVNEKPTPLEIARTINAAIKDNAEWKGWEFYPVETHGRTKGFEASNIQSIQGLPEGLGELIRDQLTQGGFNFTTDFMVRPGATEFLSR